MLWDVITSAISREEIPVTVADGKSPR